MCNFGSVFFQISSIPGLENVTAATSSTSTSSQAVTADSSAPPPSAAPPGAPLPPATQVGWNDILEEEIRCIFDDI